jgi:SRSO17 transposase
VRGLLLDGERKSVEPMAKRLPEGNEQAMQQFEGQSPWEWEPVWERLARRMVRELEPDAAWVIDDTGFPKQGELRWEWRDSTPGRWARRRTVRSQ